MAFNFCPASFTLTTQQIEFLTRQADKDGMTRSGYMRRLVEKDMRKKGIAIKPLDSQFIKK